MRIRKRPVPFLLPVAISDPLLNLNRPPPVPVVVQLGHHDFSCDAVSPQRPDRPIGPGSSRDGCDLISDKEDQKEKRVRPEFLFEDQDEKEKGNDIRKENISSAQTVCGFHHKSSPKYSSPSQVMIPPKKRSRGNNITSVNTTSFDNKIPKTRSANKCSKNDDVYGGGDDDHDDQEIQESSSAGGTGVPATAAYKKKAAGASGRGGALMEGSRCSRVNGRGWRCCQQTLVGYSLCEHHLGKGRLRSMTSVRSRSLTKATTTTATTTTTSTGTTAYAKAVVPGNDNEPGVKEGIDYEETRDHDDRGGNDHDHKTNKSGGKKRMKLGMVKARSISSLLGQTANSTTTTTSGAISMVDHDQYSK